MKTTFLSLIALAMLALVSPGHSAEAQQQWEYARLYFDPNALPGIKTNPGANAYVFRVGKIRVTADTDTELLKRLVESQFKRSAADDLWAAIGEEGWELVAVDTQAKTQLTTSYFKRPKKV